MDSIFPMLECLLQRRFTRKCVCKGVSNSNHLLKSQATLQTNKSNPQTMDRLLVNSNSGCGSACNFLLKLLPARIFSPQMMNPMGTKLSPKLMNASKEQDHATPSELIMLSTASGITAPAILRAAAQAASAEEAKMPYASAISRHVS